MLQRFRFNITYCILAVLLFAIEILIALFVHDAIIRPYVGDLLVVVLIYCFVKTFFDTRVLPTVISVLIFSYGVETAQYFKLVYVLGLGGSKLARLVIGSSFEWIDMLMYTAGAGIVLMGEYFFTVVKPPAAVKK